MARPIRTFFYDKPLVTGVYELTGKEAEHATGSFRLGPGDPLRLIDGSGLVGLAEIQELLPSGLRLRIFEVIEAGASPMLPRVILAVSIPKERRMDWMVEKCTELGAEAIIPVEFRRSLVRDRPGRVGKAEKWARTAREAAKQCGRPAFPEIRGFLKFRELLGVEAEEKFLLDPEADQALSELSARAPGSRILVAVGPEGGLDDSERDRALAAGFLAARLGPYTLKIETAAAAATAILLSRTLQAAAAPEPPGGKKEDPR